MKKLMAFAAVLALLVSACVPATELGKVEPERLADADWQLLNIQYADGRVSEPTFGEYSLEFDFDEERMYVVADCNQGSAGFEATDDGRLVLGPIALTRMACPAGSISDEFVAELGLGSSFSFEEGHLIVHNLDGNSLVFRR